MAPRPHHSTEPPRARSALGCLLILLAELATKGIRLVPSIDAADLELSYIAALENEADPEQVAAFYTQYPEVGDVKGDPRQFQQGVFYAKVVERRTRAKIWEGTRGVALLAMPAEQRAALMAARIRELLADFPE